MRSRHDRTRGIRQHVLHRATGAHVLLSMLLVIALSIGGSFVSGAVCGPQANCVS